MNDILHLDYETKHVVDLRKTGLHIYARAAGGDVWCASYAFNDEPIQLWLPGQPCPERVRAHILARKEVWAHNAAFEFEITNHIMAKKYDWPKLEIEQMVCTMVMAYAMGLPGNLEGCAAALGIKEQKDMEGSRLMIQMCKPREIKKDGTVVWWDDPEKIERLSKYCIQDTAVERMAGARMLKLSPYEQKVWILDQKINARGITADTKALFNALMIVENEKERLNQKMRDLTGNKVATCTAVQQLKDYLEFYGIPGESLDKPSVLEHLAKENLNPKARAVLELRTEAGKASTAKFEPMLTGAGEGNRVRGCFQYSGANTRRWAGRRIQLQNLKRPTIKHEIIEMILAQVSNGATAEEINMFFGPPLHVLGDCTRSFLTAAPGHELLVCDFSAIEARVLAWLAGQESTLNVFRNNLDIYKVAAASIFSKRVEDVTDQERQVGKVAVLALGYGGGVGAFQTMAKGYNVKMAPAYPLLLHRANDYQLQRVEENFKSNGKRYEIGKEEFFASDLTKMFWREANQNIVAYWEEVENASRLAVDNPGMSVKAGPDNRAVYFKKQGSFLWCRLPSSGVLCYPYPEIKETKTPWGQVKQLLTYMSEESQSRKWARCSSYGGSLVENITQATARDLLADAMLRLEEKNYPIIAHVHDEVVCEVPAGHGSIAYVEQIMCQNPVWAKDLPIEAKGFRSFRYRK